MGYYKADIRDIEFNLTELLKVQDWKDFGLEENDVKGILAEYNKYVENEVFPTREPSDHVGVKHVNGKVIVPESLHGVQKSFYANGWFALGMPAETGGTPVPESLYVACMSLATGANCAWTMYPGLSRAALNVINLKGNDFMKTNIIPKMMEGTWGGTMCLTEPGAGSDVGALRSTAKPLGNGKYSIKGTKIFISSGESDLYENNIHLVLARTPNGGEGSKGISLFVVPRFKINDDGSMGGTNHVICSKIEHKMGIHASATCEMQFGTDGETEGWLIGDEFDGMATMFIMMNEARLYCGIQGESQANAAYMMAEKYTKERVQFGKEIINHPDVRRNLLTMRAQARGMRALCLYTANLFNKAHKDPKAEAIIGLLTPICKAYCSETGFQVSSNALQAHGGYGYCTEYGVEQYVRDTQIAMIYEGTNGIQAIDFVMRKILKDGGKTLTALTAEIVAAVQSLDDAKFKKEKDIFNKVLLSAQGVMQHISTYAKNNQFNMILQNCTDFLNFASQMVIAWQLLESAVLADKKLASASADDKKYYESKVTDFRVYCAHYLIHNLSTAKTITDFTEDMTTLEI
ncbi:acyl-CoA dehydrogenase [Peredibacter starrii]|uniref:Acyl-CoA dehydrogenase n=1 Tax=Peredibacter starrii TaxID=28202 RepID=A0AAX4HS76_9BACT|nr:acyl-CoA dehydrogenase [Peredibacter starrii]WPU65943.1 acyl-CoA dehydrogenase [Peredibacter starrii]